MTGLAAVYAFDEVWRVGKFLYYALLALQHRGSDEVRAYTWSGSGIVGARGELAPRIFRELPGHVGIAASYPGYLEVDRLGGRASFNGFEVVALIDTEPSGPLARGIARELARRAYSSTLLEAADVLAQYSGLHAALVLSSRGELLAYRGHRGVRPLVVGGYGFDMVVVASETPGIEVLGAEPRRELEPGEVLYVSRHGVRPARIAEPSGGLCAMEMVYLARPDSTIGGVEVYRFRRELGRALAREFSGEADVVVGVPETALPYAVGFAEGTNTPLELGFVATGCRSRSALKLGPVEKLVAIQLKMSPVKGVFRGKRVAIVDDSLVTGSTVKTVVQILRNRVGAREVHVLIASPPIVAGCPYGVLALRREELLAANLDRETTLRYTEADSLTWIPLEALEEVASRYGLRLCARCFGIDRVVGARP
ncbi:MAG: amidophosphoribosyltransferase [Thermoprotei archaeon]|nr:MAG: amidophosphoribosyltransferase [Thermoprotei archaeon]